MGATQFGMSEFKVLGVYESEDGVGLKYEVEARRKPTQCPHCKESGHLQTHGLKTQTIRDLPLSGKQVVLEVKVRRYKCLACGKTFFEQFDNIDDSLFTKRLRDCIVMRVLRRETFTRIASDYSYPARGFAEEAFDSWCNSIPDHLPEFISLRSTFESRREHILNYFDQRFTNAFAESANSVIKGIEKQGKGYDFDTLKRIALFSSRVDPVGRFDHKTAVFRPSHEF